MTNILIEGISHIASYDLTIKDFNRYAEVLPIAVRSKLTRDIVPDDISWCDIFISVRANNPLSAWIVRKAAKKGRKVILILDDDLLNYTSGQHSIIDRLMKQSLDKVLRISSDVITISKYLGEKYKKTHNINYILIDTIFEGSEIRKTLPSTDKVKIIYAASKGHVVFFDKLISPILDKLYDKYENSVSLTVIGPEVKKENFKLEIEQVHSMPMKEYQDYMKTHQFDIGLAPLFDTEFCYSKYYNKYIEYSKNNIFGIYSNQLPYTAVILDRKNGLLVSESPDAWYESICNAIDNQNLREKGVLCAQQQLLANNNLKVITEKLLSAIPYITSFKAPMYKCKSCYFLYIRFLLYEFLRRTLVRISS